MWRLFGKSKCLRCDWKFGMSPLVNPIWYGWFLNGNIQWANGEHPMDVRGAFLRGTHVLTCSFSCFFGVWGGWLWQMWFWSMGLLVDAHLKAAAFLWPRFVSIDYSSGKVHGTDQIHLVFYGPFSNLPFCICAHVFWPPDNIANHSIPLIVSEKTDIAHKLSQLCHFQPPNLSIDIDI